MRGKSHKKQSASLQKPQTKSHKRKHDTDNDCYEKAKKPRHIKQSHKQISAPKVPTTKIKNGQFLHTEEKGLCEDLLIPTDNQKYSVKITSYVKEIIPYIKENKETFIRNGLTGTYLAALISIIKGPYTLKFILNNYDRFSKKGFSSKIVLAIASLISRHCDGRKRISSGFVNELLDLMLTDEDKFLTHITKLSKSSLIKALYQNRHLIEENPTAQIPQIIDTIPVHNKMTTLKQQNAFIEKLNSVIEINNKETILDEEDEEDIIISFEQTTPTTEENGKSSYSSTSEESLHSNSETEQETAQETEQLSQDPIFQEEAAQILASLYNPINLNFRTPTFTPQNSARTPYNRKEHTETSKSTAHKYNFRKRGTKKTY